MQIKQDDNAGSQQHPSNLAKKSKEAENLVNKVKKYGLLPKEIAYHNSSLYGSFFDQLNERKVDQGKIRQAPELRTVACEYIANDLLQGASSESYGIQSAQARNYIIKLMAEKIWQGELELRALTRALKMIVVVFYNDGKNSKGKDGPDIYKPAGSSKDTPIITLNYRRGVNNYQSLSNLQPKPSAFLKLVKLVETFEEDKKPLSDSKSITPVKFHRVSGIDSYPSSSHSHSSSSFSSLMSSLPGHVSDKSQTFIPPPSSSVSRDKFTVIHTVPTQLTKSTSPKYTKNG